MAILDLPFSILELRVRSRCPEAGQRLQGCAGNLSRC
jgi:hypothetical protein